MILGIYLNKLESLCPRDAPYSILSDLMQQFFRRRFFKHFPIYMYMYYYVKV